MDNEARPTVVPASDPGRRGFLKTVGIGAAAAGGVALLARVPGAEARPTGIKSPAIVIEKLDNGLVVARDPDGRVISSSTDASTVIQAAIDLDHKLLVVPATYTISTQLLPRDSTTIEGMGEGAVFQAAANPTVTYGPNVMIWVEAKSNVRIHNLKMKGNATTLAGGLVTEHLLFFRDSQHAKVTGCRFEDTTKEAFSFNTESATTAKGLIFTGNTITRFGQHASLEEGGVEVDAVGCVITNNVFDGERNGTTVAGLNYGLIVKGTDNIISNNTIRNTYGGIVVTSPAFISTTTRINITGNIIDTIAYDGIRIQNNSTHIRAIDNIVTTQSGTTGVGIKVASGSTYAVIRGNRIANIALQGIVVAATDCRIIDNDVETTIEHAILIQTARCTIKNNRVRNAGTSSGNRTGILLEGATLCIIEGNRVFDDRTPKGTSHGIREISAANSNLVVGNYVRATDVITGAFVQLGTNSIYRDNHTDALIQTKTAAYTALNSDELIFADATAAPFTVTLPAAAVVAGRRLTVKKTDSSANAVTVDANGAETIDGALTFVLSTQYAAVTIVSNGTTWMVI